LNMASYTVSHRAYVKVFLHAAKHPHKPVNGVLLGKLTGSNTVTIEDAIPLLHHWTSLSPMMEIGLDLVGFMTITGIDRHSEISHVNKARTHAEATGCLLVGYYQACERLDEKALEPVGEKVASKIRDSFQHAVAFVVCEMWLIFLPNFLKSHIRSTGRN
jgi:hypothetical protein